MEPREVDSVEAAEIILNNAQEGYFYLMDDDIVEGIVSQGGKIEVKDFSRKSECISWLKAKAAAKA